MRAALQGMTSRLRAEWQRLPAPRRRLALGTALMISAVLVLWSVQLLAHTRAALRRSVPELRAQALLLEQRAAEFGRLRARPAASVDTDLRALLQAELHAGGLTLPGDALEMLDGGRVRVSFATIAFADWLHLLERLQSRQVQDEACSVQALPSRGRVQASVTLAIAREP